MKEAIEELTSVKETNRSLMTMIENLQREEEDLKKECQSLRASLENQGKTKENK
jgi:translation initiation factor 1 (eIF-1/SUI1)